MTSYKKDNDPLFYLMPLYVKGLLPDSEREEFERLLAARPELKEELDKWKNIGDAYKRIECELPWPSGIAYAKIAGRIGGTGRKNFFERFMPAPSLSFALIAVQFVIIIFLAVYVADFKKEYRTLSAPATTIERPVRINVVFKEGASEAQIRALLLELDAKVVDGPFKSGLYVVGITSEKELERALNLITNSGIAIVAERAY